MPGSLLLCRTRNQRCSAPLTRAAAAEPPLLDSSRPGNRGVAVAILDRWLAGAAAGRSRVPLSPGCRRRGQAPPQGGPVLLPPGLDVGPYRSRAHHAAPITKLVQCRGTEQIP